nr:C6 transcription factor [Colletotrichum truncatum]KAF6793088.1 C6 transcription factor [Colletotrichum truncatum]
MKVSTSSALSSLVPGCRNPERPASALPPLTPGKLLSYPISFPPQQRDSSFPLPLIMQSIPDAPLSGAEQGQTELLPGNEESKALPALSKQPTQRLSCDHCRNRKVGGIPFWQTLFILHEARFDAIGKNHVQDAFTFKSDANIQRSRGLDKSNVGRSPPMSSTPLDVVRKLLEDGAQPRMSEAYSAHHLSNPNSPSATPATMSNSQEGTSPIHEIELSESEYEGDSALSAHTAFATKFLENVSQYCIEHHRPMMAWNLNCTAARMSQALGFHKACMQDPARSIERRRKARLFASIYRTDKMFSLRLGRGSMIRDEEIPLDYKEMLNGVNTAPYKLAPYWIGFAHIQGLVYDKLYSPRALQQPQEVRYSHARKILDELEILLAEKCELKSQEQFNRSLCTVVGNDLQEILERGDRVSQLALKCLIYRGVSSSARGVPFHEECISLAREALMEHRRCISSLAQHESSNVELYMHWAILSSPFVPFIVILCNVVETRNLADLELLRIMAGSIEELGESLPAVLMQLKVFQPLYEAANKFIRAKTSSTPQTDDFGSFFQETNTGVLLDPTFLSSATQNDHHNGARDAGKNYLDASFLDIWTQLDSYQLNVHMAQEEQSKGP